MRKRLQPVSRGAIDPGIATTPQRNVSPKRPGTSTVALLWVTRLMETHRSAGPFRWNSFLKVNQEQ